MTPTDESFQSPSLKERIDAWSAEHANDFPPEVLQIFSAKTEEILKSEILETCFTTGDSVPNFSLQNQAGEVVQLSERLANGPVILSFYRGAWCPYCTIEFQALLETVPHFKARSASVLAISPQVSNRIEDPQVAGFEDLCDEANQVARGFGLVYPLGDEIKKIYQRFGIRLEDLNGDDSYEVPISATYIVGRDSVIRYAYASADFKERAEPDMLLRSLNELN